MLASLGILISGARKSDRPPEEALVLSFAAAIDDYRALTLAHTWVQRNHDLIHAEALVAALRRAPPQGVSKLVAGALFATEQKRFDRILKLARTERARPALHRNLSFAVDIGQFPKEPSYAEFGLKVSEITLAAKRKFRPREYLVQANPFFFCRTLFGVNWRADVAASILLERADNPTEVAKFLGCSYDAAYRNYRDLLSVGWGQQTRQAFGARPIAR